MRVVTATYNDEKHLYWIRNLKIPYTIYKKDDTLQVGDEIPDHISCPNIRMILPVKRIPNIGRCDYAFLYHIIQNYDNLDDVTIFVKCNWAQYGINFGGLVNQCHAYDYMVKGTHPETIDWDLAIECPVDPDKLADNAAQWYRTIFPPPIPTPGSQRGWGHGPCFSVSKRLIQRHPKSVYQYLLEEFYPESGSYSQDYVKHGFSDSKCLLLDVGIIYHNELLRFYTLLFTHNLDPDVGYKIDEPNRFVDGASASASAGTVASASAIAKPMMFTRSTRQRRAQMSMLLVVALFLFLLQFCIFVL